MSLRRIFHSLPDSTSSCVKNVAAYRVPRGSHAGLARFRPATRLCTVDVEWPAAPFSASSEGEAERATPVSESGKSATGGSEATSRR